MTNTRFSRTGFTLTLSFFLGITGVALAQSPIQFLSSTVKAGQPVPQACLAQAKVLEAKLALYPQRKGWTNVIACDDLAWQNAYDLRGRNIIAVGNYLIDFSGHKQVFDAANFVAPRTSAVNRRLQVAAVPATPTPTLSAPVPHEAM